MLSRAFSPILSFSDLLGHPLSGGVLYTYISGTEQPIATFKDNQGGLNPPAIRLNSRGECEVWLDTSIKYRFVLKNAVGVTIMDKNDVTTESKSFTAEGADGITVQEEVVDGRTVLHFGIADNSITKDKLHNPRELIVDAETMEMVAKDIGGKKYIVLKSKGGGGGASEEYVDAKVAAEARARGYEDELLRQSIPTKTSQLQNDSGFLKTNGILSSRIPVYFNTFTKYYQSIDNDNLSTRLSGFIDQSLRLIVIATSVKITTPNFSPVYATSDGCGSSSWPAVGFIDIPGFVANNRIASYIQMFESYNEAKGYPAGIIVDQGSSRLALVVNSDCKLNSNGNNDTWYNFPPVSIMY